MKVVRNKMSTKDQSLEASRKTGAATEAVIGAVLRGTERRRRTEPREAMDGPRRLRHRKLSLASGRRTGLGHGRGGGGCACR